MDIETIKQSCKRSWWLGVATSGGEEMSFFVSACVLKIELTRFSGILAISFRKRQTSKEELQILS